MAILLVVFQCHLRTENVKIQNFKLNGRSIANGKVNDILKTGTLQINDETHHIGVSPNNTASNEPKRISDRVIPKIEN